MNFERFEKNLIDNIKEAQLKLGYDNRPMSLNYMTASLKNLTGEDITDDLLSAFSEYVSPRLGTLSFRPIKDGICITISAEGTSYVNSLTGYDFLAELIKKVSSHTSLEEVTAVFRRYSDNVVIEESTTEEFDLLAYFPDKSPDEYYYCLAAEPCISGGCHAMYHRFIREDYEEMFSN
ncbi:MAG: DUF3877 family protein [Ruminococcus sp.]|nr:DUF3877 family protein [Ruminococcus sp.]